MDTIKNYLDNMFAVLPRTNQMLKLKNDILSNMEDKYNELKRNGKSENEAIGIVISEFGNIDELISELGIAQDDDTQSAPTVTADDAQVFIAAKKGEGLLMGIGGSLCILAATALIFITKLVDDGLVGAGLPTDIRDMLGFFALFILFIPAAVLFIYSSMRMEKFKYLDSEFILPAHVKASVLQKSKDFAPYYNLSVIVGVCLCLLSPVAFLTSNFLEGDYGIYGLVVLLLMVSAAVFIFIFFGCIKGSYNKLLKINEYSAAAKKQGKVIGMVAAIVWPLATCIFFVSGMVFNLWRINWIIFPVTAILFAMFAGSYSIMKEK